MTSSKDKIITSWVDFN